MQIQERKQKYGKMGNGTLKVYKGKKTKLEEKFEVTGLQILAITDRKKGTRKTKKVKGHVFIYV